MSRLKLRKARLSPGVQGTMTNAEPSGGVRRPCLPFRENDQCFLSWSVTNSLISFTEQYFIAIHPGD